MSCETKWIKENAVKVLEHVIKPVEYGGMGYAMNDVILYGRSLGTGPATYLASLNASPYALILVSPFTTIKKVA